MKITQLNPPIRVLTPLGSADAYFLWADDRSAYFGVFQDQTGEQWWFENHLIRLEPSITFTPHKTTPIVLPQDMEAALAKHRKRAKAK